MSLVSQEIDDLPFIAALQKTAEKGWSGILRVMKETEQVGSVFMSEGQVGWAVSNTQVENFGSFLERIGMVPKDKLEETVQRYKALGKAKKLGTLLIEEGLISNAKLRECLRAHIRAALNSMSEDQELVIQASHGEMTVEANLIFGLNEVLPNHHPTSVPTEFIDSSTTNESNQFSTLSDCSEKLNTLLGTLDYLPGYLFSFISETNGELKALHIPDQGLDDEEIINSSIKWVSASAKSSQDGCFGHLEAIILEHEKGKLIAQQANGNHNYFIAMAFDREGKLGVIKHKMTELIPSILKHIAPSNN